MPTTAARQRYWNRAIRSFQAQTWPNKRLLIGLDVAGVLPSIGSNIEITVCPRSSSLGGKRNWLNSRATGEWIAHWDDDDWSELDRLEKQFQAAKTAVVGCRNAIFWDEPTSQAWLYSGVGQYVIGSSLMYRRDYWLERQFEALNVGEDNAFVAKARARGHLTVMDDLLVVATSHSGNTSRRQYHTKQWRKAEKTAVPDQYFL